MSNFDRPLAGRPLVLRLGSDRSTFIDADQLETSGRAARTLVKDGTLRVTLVAIAPGGRLAEHTAPGPISVHVLKGDITFSVGDEAWALEAGDLLSLGGGVRHAVESREGGEFLLTMSLPA
jgi:quercetin dioxygenase-like cupin family protein